MRSGPVLLVDEPSEVSVSVVLSDVREDLMLLFVLVGSSSDVLLFSILVWTKRLTVTGDAQEDHDFWRVLRRLCRSLLAGLGDLRCSRHSSCDCASAQTSIIGFHQ